MKFDLDASSLGSPILAEPKEMLTVTEADGVTKVSINFSSLSILQECQRKAEYSLIRGLKSNLESPALLFGTAIHKALEVYYSGERTERRIPSEYRDIMQMIGCGQWEPAWSESLLFRAARAFVEKAAPLSALPDDNKRSIATGVWVLSHYFQSYLTDEYVVCRDSAGPIVERRFDIPLIERENLQITLFGTIDIVMKNEVTGHILGADHKTSSSLYQFYDSINPNLQYSGYILGINRALGIETNDFMVNALEIKPPPKTSRGSPPNFARQITQRTEEDFAELTDAIDVAVEAFLTARKRNRWAMSAPGSCMKYSGCEYRQACSTQRQLRETVIQANYRMRT